MMFLYLFETSYMVGFLLTSDLFTTGSTWIPAGLIWALRMWDAPAAVMGAVGAAGRVGAGRVSAALQHGSGFLRLAFHCKVYRAAEDGAAGKATPAAQRAAALCCCSTNMKQKPAEIRGKLHPSHNTGEKKFKLSL